MPIRFPKGTGPSNVAGQEKQTPHQTEWIFFEVKMPEQANVDTITDTEDIEELR